MPIYSSKEVHHDQLKEYFKLRDDYKPEFVGKLRSKTALNDEIKRKALLKTISMLTSKECKSCTKDDAK